MIIIFVFVFLVHSHVKPLLTKSLHVASLNQPGHIHPVVVCLVTGASRIEHLQNQYQNKLFNTCIISLSQI